MRWLAALALMAFPAMADPLGLVEYDALIAAHITEAAPRGDGTFLITLPGGVEVISDPEGRLVTARDRGGAVGCAVNALAELTAAARSCAGAMTPGQADGLDSAVALLLPAYGAGILPRPVPEAGVQARFEALIAAYRRAPALCDLSTAAAALLNLVNSEDGRAWLAEVAAAPRLPVMNPCF